MHPEEHYPELTERVESNPSVCGFIDQADHPPLPLDPSSSTHPQENNAVDIPDCASLTTGCTQYRRVACKARSVPESHTAQNAYFDIPHNAQHGMLLVCSHPSCATSGRRFRYCSVCELPVAKRNFMKRHAHGLVTSKRMISTESDQLLPVLDAETTSASSSFKRCSDEVLDDVDEYLCQLENLDGSCNLPIKRQALEVPAPSAQQFPNEIIKKEQQELPVPGTTSVEDTANDQTKANLRLVNWISLLQSRPNIHDSDGMMKWIEKVIAVSESHDEKTTAAAAAPQHILSSEPSPGEFCAPEFFTEHSTGEISANEIASLLS